MNGWKRLRRLMAIALMVSTLLLGGCWDLAAVNELVIVLTLGIDVGDEPGTYAVTLEMINPGGAASTEGGDPGSLPKATIITRQGRTIVEAIQAIQRTVDRGIFLGQLQVVLFGEELAREGITATLDHLRRNGQLRRTMNVGIARGSARSMMQATAPTPTLLGIALDGTFLQAVRTGYVSTIFGDFLQYLVEPGASALVPVIERSDDGSVTLTGTAAFQDDRLVGIFSTYESLGVALATGQARPSLVLVGETEWSGEHVLASFYLRRLTSPLDVRVEDGIPKAVLRIRVESVLAEQTGGGDFTTSKDWSILEQMQEEAVRHAVEAAVKRAQEWKTDVFRIGSSIEHRFPREWARLQDEWPEVFSRMEIEVEVASRILETGLIKESLETLERKN